MKSFQILSFLIISLLSTVFFQVQQVLALTSCPDSRTTLQSGVCVPTEQSTGLSGQSVSVILYNFLDWLLVIFGILAILAFVISGLQYLLAAGDEKSIETAKRNMIWSIVGVIIALSSYMILQAVFAALNASPLF